VFGKSDIRITQIDGFGIDVVPQGIVIFSSHVDKPGIIGKFGAVLGKAGINIAGMHLGREERGKQAVMILSVDDPVPPEVVKELASLEGIERLRVVQF
jgi:D-3-phosphoglycerate dehydrogenase